MFKQPLESNTYKGFYFIPGFGQYVISRHGKVIDTESGLEKLAYENSTGYLWMSLVGDDGISHLQSVHRLLCLTFKNPGIDVSKLQVNHIDGNRSNNELDNLEWTTPMENTHHAGMTGLSPKCIPVQVRNVDTGEIEIFPSAVQAAEKYGLTRDALMHRVHYPETRVWPERRQYRQYTDTPWQIPVDIEKEMKRHGTSRPVVIRDVMTGEEKEFGGVTEAAAFIKCFPSVLTRWINKLPMSILPGYYQAKWAWDPTPWREINDPKKELWNFYARGIRRPVKVTDKNGEIFYFNSIKDCCKKFGLKETALSYRLNHGTSDSYEDGLKFEFYK